MDQVRNFATQLITQLVDKQVLAKEVNGTWTLTTPILGYVGDVAFPSRQELIEKLCAAAISHFQQSSTRAAS